MSNYHVHGTVLYQDNSYSISVKEQADAKGLVYTFSYFNWGHLRDAGFSEKYWLDAGFNVVSIQSTINDWFNALPLDVLAKVAAPLSARYALRIGYGGSMGGFAALALRDMLNLTHVIALAPQFSVTGAFDERWSGYMTSDHVHKIVRSDAERKCLLIYDPCSLDALHAQRIAAVVENCSELRLPNVGHYPGMVLNEIGLLDEIQKSFIQDELLDRYCRVFKRMRTQSRIFLTTLSRKLASRRWKYAVHARLLLTSIEPLLPTEAVLAQKIANRFQDLSNFWKLFGAENFNLDDYPKLMRMRRNIDQSAAIPAKLSAVRMGHVAAANTFTLSTAPTINSYLVIDTAVTRPGRYRIDFQIPFSDVRFFSVLFSKNEAGFPGNSSYLDVFGKMAFNSNEDFFVAFSDKPQQRTAFSIYFDAPSSSTLRLLLFPLASLAGIKPAMRQQPEFSLQLCENPTVN